LIKQKEKYLGFDPIVGKYSTGYESTVKS